MYRAAIFCLVLFVVFGRTMTARADDDCSAVVKDVPGEQVIADAGTWTNLRKAEGSLRYESERLLNAAEKKRAALQPPAGLCPAGCIPISEPEIVFISVPQKFLDSYRDQQKCERLLKQTTAAPLAYHDRTFSSAAEFNDWFGDFSQGKGDDGRTLYRQCDGSCSPRYTCIIKQQGAALHVDADVICGPARDKSDDTYKLSSSYRWTCRKQG
jgi:hypothetical protein